MPNGTSLLLAKAKVHVMALGGAVKRLAARANPQRTEAAEPILDPVALYNFAVTVLPSITFTFTTSEEHESHRLLLQKRFNNARTISGKVVHEIITIYFSTQQREIAWK